MQLQSSDIKYNAQLLCDMVYNSLIMPHLIILPFDAIFGDQIKKYRIGGSLFFMKQGDYEMSNLLGIVTYGI